VQVRKFLIITGLILVVGVVGFMYLLGEADKMEPPETETRFEIDVDLPN